MSARYIRLRAYENKRGLMVNENVPVHILSPAGYPICMDPTTAASTSRPRRVMKDGDPHTETLDRFPDGGRCCASCGMGPRDRNNVALWDGIREERADRNTFYEVRGKTSGVRGNEILRRFR